MLQISLGSWYSVLNFVGFCYGLSVNWMIFRWQNYNDPDEKVRISHPVTNFEFLYEPFYISTDNVPPHDERFIGYGYTRNSQVYQYFD